MSAQLKQRNSDIKSYKHLNIKHAQKSHSNVETNKQKQRY